MEICSDILHYNIFPFLSISDYFLFMQLSKNTYEFTHRFISLNKPHIKKLFKQLLNQKMKFFKDKISTISCIYQYKHFEWYFFIDDLFYKTNHSQTFLHKLFNPLLQYKNDEYYWSQYHTNLYIDIHNEIKNSFKNNYIKFKKKFYNK